MSFRDLDAYGDDWSGAWRAASAMPSFWSVVNRKDYGGPHEKIAALLKWKNEALIQLAEWREPITRVQRVNDQLYKGRHYFSQEEFSNLPYNKNRKYSKNNAKLVCNHMWNVTENHVSDMSGYEPNLTVTPNNNEEADKNAARMNKECLDYYFYEHNLKVAWQVFHRRKKVHGEAFYFVLWNKDAGEMHPKYRELRRIRSEMGQDPDMTVPLMDPETGLQIFGEDGNPLFITPTMKTGDISLEQDYSSRVYYPHPPSGLWSDVPYLIRLVWMDIDDVRAAWPHASEDIKPDGILNRYVQLNKKTLHQQICVRYMYHKPTRNLPRGYYCISTEHAMLEGGDYPFNHNHLPCIRGTDIDVPGELTGMSFYQNLVTLQYAINNSTSMILQNQALFAYPKYVSPRGAKVKPVALGDDREIYEYSGPRPPELVANNSTPPDTWRWRDAMRDEFKTLSQVFSTSQGQPPGGITANVALRMIDEQERKLHKPAIDKHGRDVELFGTLLLATLGTYRDPSDGMLIKVLGKNNERLLRFFDVSNFGRSYEVKLARSSGLPESPAAKTQTVFDMADRWPQMWESDEVLEMLDIARPEKLIDSATVSRKSAESEVEDILAGMDVPPPQPYHDILPRYRVYEKAMQSRAFDEADPVRKQKLLNHVMTAEYLIWKRISNPVVQAYMAEKHPCFPIAFVLPKPGPAPMMLPVAPPMGPLDPTTGAPMLGGIPPEMAMDGASMMPGAAPLAQNSVPSPDPLAMQAVPEPGALP